MLIEMTDIAVGQEALPQAPVRTMEGVAIILEQIQDDVLTRLGGISLQGVSAAEQEWIDQVSDVAERIQVMTDLVFRSVNEIGRPVEPVLLPVGLHLVPEQTPFPEQEKIETSILPVEKDFDRHTIHELLTFSMRNPSFRAEELKKSGNRFVGLDPRQFKSIRGDVVAYLASHGVVATWEITGKTRGQRYDLTVTSGHETIAQLVLQAGSAETPAGDISEVDADETPLAPEPQASIVELPLEVKEEVSVAELVSRGAPLNLKQIVFEKYGVHNLPQNVFHELHAEIRAAVDAGLIKRLKNGRYAETAYVEMTQTAADVDKMLKDLRRETGIQTTFRKPRNRGRGNRRT